MTDHAPLPRSREISPRARASLHLIVLLLTCGAAPWVFARVSLVAAVIAGIVALALVVVHCADRSGRIRMPVPGAAVVIGEILVSGVAVAAGLALEGKSGFAFVALVLADVLLQVPKWRGLLSGGDRGRAAAARTAAAATALLVAATLLSPALWPRAADVAACLRLSVCPGPSADWPNGYRLDGAAHAGRKGGTGPLDTIAQFRGNEAFGPPRWWLPGAGREAVGNETSLALAYADGLGVYGAEDGSVRWTYRVRDADRLCALPVGFWSSPEISTISAAGDTLLVLFRQEQDSEDASHQDSEDASHSALRAFDFATGRELWCEPGVTEFQVDAEFPERIVARHEGWSILATSDGRRVADLAIERTSLAKAEGGSPPLAFPGGGNLVLTRGAAMAVYDISDGGLVYDALLHRAPDARQDGVVDSDEPGGRAIYGVLSRGSRTVVEVGDDMYLDEDVQESVRQKGGTALIAFGPEGEEVWRRGTGGPGGVERFFPLGPERGPETFGVPALASNVVFADSGETRVAIRVSDGADAWAEDELVTYMYRGGYTRHTREEFVYENTHSQLPTAIDIEDGSATEFPRYWTERDPISYDADHSFVPTGGVLGVDGGLFVTTASRLGKGRDSSGFTLVMGPPDDVT